MKLVTRSLLLLVAVLFVFGCATKTPLPQFEAQSIDMKMYESKVDNFLILFDASRSLQIDGTFPTAKAVVTRMNQTIPELGQTAGLRSFGHDPSVSPNQTEMFYGMEKYSTAGLQAGFDKIHTAGGYSPINLGLDAAVDTDLKGLSGSNAVIIISDGKDLPREVLPAAQRLKDAFGDDICFYTIHIGDSENGKGLMQKIAEIGGCGFSTDAENILTGDAMANFVQQAFLKQKSAPAAPPAPKVSMKKDSDGDGVYDDADQCPGTPMGAKVNKAGCWVLDNVLFDFDKDAVRAVAQPMLNNVVMVMEKSPGLNIELQGHCDNIGSADYNMGLSNRRANSVKTYLVNAGISADRIMTKGFGFNKPVALNDTDQGRALNRRVEIHPAN